MFKRSTRVDETVPELISCARCMLPIPKGTLYVERKDGQPVHWRCTMGALGDLLDAENGLGGTIGVAADPPRQATGSSPGRFAYKQAAK